MVCAFIWIQWQQFFSFKFGHPQSASPSKPQQPGLAIVGAIDIAGVKEARDLIDLGKQNM